MCADANTTRYRVVNSTASALFDVRYSLAARASSFVTASVLAAT